MSAAITTWALASHPVVTHQEVIRVGDRDRHVGVEEQPDGSYYVVSSLVPVDAAPCWRHDSDRKGTYDEAKLLVDCKVRIARDLATDEARKEALRRARVHEILRTWSGK